jgi:hypothetical protein
MKTHLPPGYTQLTTTLKIYYNVWGNVAYGYVGWALGIPPSFLQQAAEDAGNPVQTNTPGNWIERQMGIDMYGNYSWEGALGGITASNMDASIKQSLVDLAQYCDVLNVKQTSCPRGKVW